MVQTVAPADTGPGAGGAHPCQLIAQKTRVELSAETIRLTRQLHDRLACWI